MSYDDQLVWQQRPEEFINDVESSVKLLQDITGQPVECFRAPGFSIRKSEAWAFEILSDLGIKYDSSIFPAHHAHGGMPEFQSSEPTTVRYGACEIKEFPISYKNIAGKHLVFSGGGYFRLFPYPLIKKWSMEHSDYLLSYIHPRDLDGGQPMLEGLPLARKFKSYVGTKGDAKKLEKYLTYFEFTDIATAVQRIDWNDAPTFTLYPDRMDEEVKARLRAIEENANEVKRQSKQLSNAINEASKKFMVNCDKMLKKGNSKL